MKIIKEYYKWFKNKFGSYPYNKYCGIIMIKKLIIMKTLKWNLGILLIRFAYFIRKHQHQPKGFNLRWLIGVKTLKAAYLLRGETPMLTYRWNHV